MVFLAGANKVEGTMSWLLGTNEILAYKHDIVAQSEVQKITVFKGLQMKR